LDWILLNKSDILYFHSNSYFPYPYFSFASYPFTSSALSSQGGCFCCCSQCCANVFVARNSSVSTTASSSANVSVYHPPYQYHPNPPSAVPTATVSIVGRYNVRNPSNSSSSNASTIPTAAVTAAASNNYNLSNRYQHFLQQSSYRTRGSHVYSNLSNPVVTGDDTNITSTSSPTSTITTATTTPIKRVQDEVEDVQMVSIALFFRYNAGE